MPSLLYLAPTFLADRRRKPLRGVQVFDLLLVRQLVELGVEVTVAAERTWRERFEEHWGGAMPRVVYTPGLRKPILNGLAAAVLTPGAGKRARAYDCTFLGNPARGVGPMVDILRARGLVRRLVLQANRAPRPGVIPALRRWGCVLTAVSRHVAEQFPPDLRARVRVCYGIANAGDFTPRIERPRDDFVRFCLIGKLDNAWKGAERAIKVFAGLPADVRAKARLHLASYQGKPPAVQDGCVTVEPWMQPGEVPGFLRRMDAMMVPSFGPEETFSQAMVQGMLCELPIVASELPVLAEKLDAGGGFACGTHEAMISAVSRMVRDAAWRREQGAIARRVALERYVWETGGFAEAFLFPGANAEA